MNVKRKTNRRKTRKNPRYPKKTTKIAGRTAYKHRPVYYSGDARRLGSRSPYAKLNPTRRKKTMAKRKRTYKRRVTRRKPRRIYRRRIRRNPSIDFFQLLVNGGIGGVSAYSTLFVAKKLSPFITKATGGKGGAQMKNIITLLLASGVGYAAHKFLDKDKAEADCTVAIAGVIVNILSTAISPVTGAEAEIDEILEDLDNDVMGLLEDDNMSGLLEESEVSGLLETDLSVNGNNDIMSVMGVDYDNDYDDYI